MAEGDDPRQGSKARLIKRVVTALAAMVLIVQTVALSWFGLWYYDLYQRYGVWDWPSQRPHFLKVAGRDYGDRYRSPTQPISPEPENLCQFDVMYPMTYPIYTKAPDGHHGNACGTDRPATPTTVYLRWRDGGLYGYTLQGAP